MDGRIKRPPPIVVKEEPLEIIDLSESRTPTEIVYEWDVVVRKQLNQQIVSEDKDAVYEKMQWYYRQLRSDVSGFEDLETSANVIVNHLKCLSSLYKRSHSILDDRYFDLMEDILVTYCNIVIDYVSKKRKAVKNREMKKIVTKESRRIKCLLPQCLMEQSDRVLHVLMKIKVDPSSQSCRNIMTNVYGHFITRLPQNSSDDNFLRGYILFQKWKLIRKPEEHPTMDTCMYKLYKKTPEMLNTNQLFRRVLQGHTTGDSILGLSLNSTYTKVSTTHPLDGVLGLSLNSGYEDPIDGMLKEYFDYAKSKVRIEDDDVVFDTGGLLENLEADKSVSEWNDADNEFQQETNIWEHEVESANHQQKTAVQIITVKQELPEIFVNCEDHVTEIFDDEDILEMSYPIKRGKSVPTKPRGKTKSNRKITSFLDSIDLQIEPDLASNQPKTAPNRTNDDVIFVPTNDNLTSKPATRSVPESAASQKDDSVDSYDVTDYLGLTSVLATKDNDRLETIGGVSETTINLKAMSICDNKYVGFSAPQPRKPLVECYGDSDDSDIEEAAVLCDNSLKISSENSKISTIFSTNPSEIDDTHTIRPNQEIVNSPVAVTSLSLKDTPLHSNAPSSVINTPSSSPSLHPPTLTTPTDSLLAQHSLDTPTTVSVNASSIQPETEVIPTTILSHESRVSMEPASPVVSSFGHIKPPVSSVPPIAMVSGSTCSSLVAMDTSSTREAAVSIVAMDTSDGSRSSPCPVRFETLETSPVAMVTRCARKTPSPVATVTNHAQSSPEAVSSTVAMDTSPALVSLPPSSVVLEISSAQKSDLDAAVSSAVATDTVPARQLLQPSNVAVEISSAQKSDLDSPITMKCESNSVLGEKCGNISTSATSAPNRAVCSDLLESLGTECSRIPVISLASKTTPTLTVNVDIGHHETSRVSVTTEEIVVQRLETCKISLAVLEVSKAAESQSLESSDVSEVNTSEVLDRSTLKDTTEKLDSESVGGDKLSDVECSKGADDLRLHKKEVMQEDNFADLDGVDASSVSRDGTKDSSLVATDAIVANLPRENAKWAYVNGVLTPPAEKPTDDQNNIQGGDNCVYAQIMRPTTAEKVFHTPDSQSDLFSDTEFYSDDIKSITTEEFSEKNDHSSEELENILTDFEDENSVSPLPPQNTNPSELPQSPTSKISKTNQEPLETENNESKQPRCYSGPKTSLNLKVTLPDETRFPKQSSEETVRQITESIVDKASSTSKQSFFSISNLAISSISVKSKETSELESVFTEISQTNVHSDHSNSQERNTITTESVSHYKKCENVENSSEKPPCESVSHSPKHSDLYQMEVRYETTCKNSDTGVVKNAVSDTDLIKPVTNTLEDVKEFLDTQTDVIQDKKVASVDQDQDLETNDLSFNCDSDGDNFDNDMMRDLSIEDAIEIEDVGFLETKDDGITKTDVSVETSKKCVERLNEGAFGGDMTHWEMEDNQDLAQIFTGPVTKLNGNIINPDDNFDLFDEKEETKRETTAKSTKINGATVNLNHLTVNSASKTVKTTNKISKTPVKILNSFYKNPNLKVNHPEVITVNPGHIADNCKTDTNIPTYQKVLTANPIKSVNVQTATVNPKSNVNFNCEKVTVNTKNDRSINSPHTRIKSPVKLVVSSTNRNLRSKNRTVTDNIDREETANPVSPELKSPDFEPLGDFLTHEELPPDVKCKERLSADDVVTENTQNDKQLTSDTSEKVKNTSDMLVESTDNDKLTVKHNNLTDSLTVRDDSSILSLENHLTVKNQVAATTELSENDGITTDLSLPKSPNLISESNESTSVDIETKGLNSSDSLENVRKTAAGNHSLTNDSANVKSKAQNDSETVSVAARDLIGRKSARISVKSAIYSPPTHEDFNLTVKITRQGDSSDKGDTSNVKTPRYFTRRRSLSGSSETVDVSAVKNSTVNTSDSVKNTSIGSADAVNITPLEYDDVRAQSDRKNSFGIRLRRTSVGKKSQVFDSSNDDDSRVESKRLGSESNGLNSVWEITDGIIESNINSPPHVDTSDTYGNHDDNSVNNQNKDETSDSNTRRNKDGGKPQKVKQKRIMFNDEVETSDEPHVKRQKSMRQNNNVLHSILKPSSTENGSLKIKIRRRVKQQSADIDNKTNEKLWEAARQAYERDRQRKHQSSQEFIFENYHKDDHQDIDEIPTDLKNHHDETRTSQKTVQGSKKYLERSGTSQKTVEGSRKHLESSTKPLEGSKKRQKGSGFKTIIPGRSLKDRDVEFEFFDSGPSSAPNANDHQYLYEFSAAANGLASEINQPSNLKQTRSGRKRRKPPEKDYEQLINRKTRYK